MKICKSFLLVNEEPLLLLEPLSDNESKVANLYISFSAKLTSFKMQLHTYHADLTVLRLIYGGIVTSITNGLLFVQEER